MNAPVLTYHFTAPAVRAFSELDEVRLLHAVSTDEGVEVPTGTEGTVVAVWADGAAYEVEFDAGLATVDAEKLHIATR